MDSIKPADISRIKSGRITKAEKGAYAEYERSFSENDELEDVSVETWEELNGLRAGVLKLPPEELARGGIFAGGRLRVAGTGKTTDVEKCGKWLMHKARVCYNTEFHPNVTVYGEHFGAQVAFEKIKSSCDSPLCSTCAASYCGREAHKIDVRINAIIEFYRKKGIVVTCEHVVVSVHPDSSEASKWLMSPQYARARANEAMRKRGIAGGVDILHAHRIRSPQRAFREGKVAGRYAAPHVHALALFFGEGNGYGRCRDCKSLSSLDCLACQGFEGTTRRQYLKDKLIVKVAEARSEGDSDFTVEAMADMENMRSLAASRGQKGTRKTIGGTAAYQLSHAAVEVSAKKNGRNHVVSWWGIASYRQFKMDDPERTVRLCPICNCEMELSRYVGAKESAPRNDKGLDSLFDERGMPRWIRVDEGG